MDKRINSLFNKDIALVFSFLTATWIVLSYVFFHVLQISPSAGFTTIFVIAFVCTLGVVTLASFSLINHLKKDKEAIYSEDIKHM